MAPSLLPSKSRRVRFTLSLTIHDLNNVPLVSGTSFIKWHLPSSTAAEHRGRTTKCPIQDHRVQYAYNKTLPVRLHVGKDGVLSECVVDFEVLQEYSQGGRGQRITLGRVAINLAEYVEGGEARNGSVVGQATSDEGVVRRYLMQDSKINSTLKVGIAMKYIEGTREFSAPHLSVAPVFGGIAGIIASAAGKEPAGGASATNGNRASSSQQDLGQEDGGAMPSLSTTSRELGEMQDMYRRTLAAHWAALPGVLKADECVEDIFSGGDGWGVHGKPAEVENGGGSSGTQTPSKGKSDGGRGRAVSHAAKISAGMRGVVGSSGHHKYSGSGRYGAKHIPPRKAPGEIDELDAREDLRSWRIGAKACG